MGHGRVAGSQGGRPGKACTTLRLHAAHRSCVGFWRLVRPEVRMGRGAPQGYMQVREEYEAGR